MLHVILIDDEQFCLDVLETLIKEYMPSIKVLGRFQNGEDAIPFILSEKPDIIFLDIEMPKLNGFELLERLKPYTYNVIFTTAHDDFAIKAYKYDVKNYLLKPITLSDLREAVHRIKKNEAQKIDQIMSKIIFSTHEGIFILSSNDILYCEADDSYCTIYLTSQKKIVVSKTLKDIEAQLAVYQHFYRLHHSYMINLNYLQKYVKSDGGHVVLKYDIELPVSRSKKDEFARIIEAMT